MTSTRRCYSLTLSALVLACNTTPVSDGEPGSSTSSTGAETHHDTTMASGTGGSTVGESTGDESSDTTLGTSTGAVVPEPDVEFELLISALDGPGQDAPRSYFVYRVVDGVAEGPVPLQEEVPGATLGSAVLVSGRRVAFAIRAPDMSTSALALVGLNWDRPRTMVRLDEDGIHSAPVGFVSGEGVLYRRASRWNYVDLREPEPAAPVPVEVAASSESGGPTIDPAGRYVLLRDAFGDDGWTRASLDGDAGEPQPIWGTGVETTGRPVLSVDGDFAVQAVTLEGAPTRLMLVDLAEAPISAPAVFDYGSETSSFFILDDDVRPRASSPGFLARVTEGEATTLIYAGASDGVPLDAVELGSEPRAEAWSADGERLFFVESGPGGNQAYLAEFGEGHDPSVHALGDPQPHAAAQAYWAPSGDAVYLRSALDSEVLLERLSVDGARETVVGPATDVQFVDFSPDGERLYFTVEDAGTLGVYGTSTAPREAGRRVQYGDDVEGGSLLSLRADLSADGRTLIYRTPSEIYAGESVLWSVRVDVPGDPTLISHPILGAEFVEG